jgi:outer membrane immunogenic protein
LATLVPINHGKPGESRDLLLLSDTIFLCNQVLIGGRAALFPARIKTNNNIAVRDVRSGCMKRLLFVGVVAFAAATQAFAADLPAPAPPPPQAPATYIPVVAPAYNWGGIYFGANGGYGVGSSKWTNPNPTFGSTGSFHVSGFLVGPTLGANFQWDALVLGIEGDLDAAWLDGNTTTGFCLQACETKNNWLGTARGRIGYASDRVLFYGTGGLAFGNIETGVAGGFDNSNKLGWTAGAGIEAAFADNWTARAEYLFVDMQSATCSTTLNCGSPAGDSVTYNTNLIRLGVDYKFR